MALTPGSRVGPYEILAPIGAGGMGEVYRARDIKLRREVAIKTLLQNSHPNEEQVARFRREAELLAALHHANVATVYGLEEQDGQLFIVMELVEGETLAARIARGPIPLKEALPLFVQIASGLEAAHERGIIHRDLKPANIIVSEDGRVKVLDFGLAKAVTTDTRSPDLSKSPTLTREGTALDVIRGTASYMSPEQARGKTLDPRTDIWSFGCVLYETLTGRKAFPGETVSDIIAAVLGREPDWKAVPRSASGKVQDLIERCLRKDLRSRLQHIGDARIAVEESLASPRDIVPESPARRMRIWLAILSTLLLATVAALFWAILRSATPAPQYLSKFVVSLPARDVFWNLADRAVAISPDGTRIVYVAQRGDTRELFLRHLDRLEATAIPGTEGAATVFFSPDGRSVGFYDYAKLKKVPLDGGPPIDLCDVTNAYGAAWAEDDHIVFSPDVYSGLWRVSSSGGSPEMLTTPDAKGIAHRWPQILPNGKGVLFTIWSGGFRKGTIAVLLPNGKHRALIEGGCCARYVPTGHLIYGTGGSKLVVVPFDIDKVEVTGPQVAVFQGVLTGGNGAAAQFDVSRNGTVVSVPDSASDQVLVWRDRKGTTELITETPRVYEQPRLSPDGRRIAVRVVGSNTDLWIYDLDRGTMSRLTFGSEDKATPVWTPDGHRIAFLSEGEGLGNIFSVFTNGAELEERLTTSENLQWPNSWAPDGRHLVFTQSSKSTAEDIFILSPDHDGVSKPFLQTQFSEGGGVISPDGQWLAYVSNESGHDEVYVQSFPEPSRKLQISTSGGVAPVWSRNGREIFYLENDKLMGVPVETGTSLQPGRPKLLFEGGFVHFYTQFADYDVSLDGQSFLMIQNSQTPEFHVVLNWFEELKQRVPANR